MQYYIVTPFSFSIYVKKGWGMWVCNVCLYPTKMCMKSASYLHQKMLIGY